MFSQLDLRYRLRTESVQSQNISTPWIVDVVVARVNDYAIIHIWNVDADWNSCNRYELAFVRDDGLDDKLQSIDRLVSSYLTTLELQAGKTYNNTEHRMHEGKNDHCQEVECHKPPDCFVACNRDAHSDLGAAGSLEVNMEPWDREFVIAQFGLRFRLIGQAR